MKAILYAGVFAVLVVFIQGRVKFSLITVRYMSLLHHYEVYNILLEFLDYAFHIIIVTINYKIKCYADIFRIILVIEGNDNSITTFIFFLY